MEVEFVDAVPTSSARRGEFQEWLDEVQANPGKWAKRSYKGKGSSSSIATAAKRAGFEATTRGTDLYVRWPEK